MWAGVCTAPQVQCGHRILFPKGLFEQLPKPHREEGRRGGGRSGTHSPDRSREMYSSAITTAALSALKFGLRAVFSLLVGQEREGLETASPAVSACAYRKG